MRVEHLVLAQEIEQIADGGDVDVVQDQHTVPSQPGVEGEVFELREWIAVRTIDQDEIHLFIERPPRDGLLRRAEDPFDTPAIKAWKRGGEVDA